MASRQCILKYLRMASKQRILVMKLEDIERKNFDGILAKRQISQNFLLSINNYCAIRYDAYFT